MSRTSVKQLTTTSVTDESALTTLRTVEIEVEKVAEDLRGPWRESSAPYDYEEHPAVETIDGAECLQLTDEPCPVCWNPQAQPTYSIRGFEFRLVTCTDCGLGRLYPMPDAEQIGRFYPAAYYGAPGSKFEPLIEALVRWSAVRHARCLTKELPRGARILDVGCGRGVLLAPLVDLGFEAHGFEINETVTEDADPRAEIRIASELSEARYPRHSFDQVILWHVFEHLPNPIDTLAEIRRILRPGGSLVVAVPNFGSAQARWAGPNWFHLDLPRHLFHFPLHTLRAMLEKNGFACQSQRHFSLRQNPFGWVQSTLNRDRSLPRNSLYTLLHCGDQAKHLLFKRPARLRLRSIYWLGMPIALAISVITAAIGTGATVFVVAKSTRSSRTQSGNGNESTSS